MMEHELPLVRFRFGVFFLSKSGLAHPHDFRFQEISGIGVRRGIEHYIVKDELPKVANYYSNLVLKRGMPLQSSFRNEVISSMESVPAKKWDILVCILDENSLPLSSFLFLDATPVKWSMSDLDANSGKAIIETIEISYRKFLPFSL